MATSINLGYCLWLDGATYNGLLGRTYHVASTFYSTGASALQVMSGVVPSSGQLTVTPGSGLAVTVATGACVVANSSGSTYGGYLMTNMSSGSLTVATADTTNPRIDIVCVTVSDMGTSASAAVIQIITGTPAATPAAPSPPGNSLVLANITVPANATSLTSANIVTQARLTVAAGGVLPVAAGSAPSGYTGAYIHDTGTGALRHNSASGVVAAHVLPFAPVMTSVTANISVSTSNVTVASLTFTTDGVTDFSYVMSSPGVGDNPDYYTYTLTVDGSQVYATIVEVVAGNEASQFFTTYYTSGSLSTTPSAGTHTLTWQAKADTGGGVLYASASAPIQLRAMPVSL